MIPLNTCHEDALDLPLPSCTEGVQKASRWFENHRGGGKGRHPKFGAKSNGKKKKTSICPIFGSPSPCPSFLCLCLSNFPGVGFILSAPPVGIPHTQTPVPFAATMLLQPGSTRDVLEIYIKKFQCGNDRNIHRLS